MSVQHQHHRPKRRLSSQARRAIEEEQEEKHTTIVAEQNTPVRTQWWPYRKLLAYFADDRLDTYLVAIRESRETKKQEERVQQYCAALVDNPIVKGLVDDEDTDTFQQFVIAHGRATVGPIATLFGHDSSFFRYTIVDLVNDCREWFRHTAQQPELSWSRQRLKRDGGVLAKLEQITHRPDVALQAAATAAKQRGEPEEARGRRELASQQHREWHGAHREIHAVFPSVGTGYEKAVYLVGPYVVKIQHSKAFASHAELPGDYLPFLSAPNVFARSARFWYLDERNEVYLFEAQELMDDDSEEAQREITAAGNAASARCDIPPYPFYMDTLLMDENEQKGLNRFGLLKVFDLG